jgi:hypothetical protein
MVQCGLNWLRAKVSSDAPRRDYEEGLKTVEAELNVWREMVKMNREMKELRVETERLDGLGGVATSYTCVSKRHPVNI